MEVALQHFLLYQSQASNYQKEAHLQGRKVWWFHAYAIQKYLLYLPNRQMVLE